MSKAQEMESGKKCIIDFSNEYIKRLIYIYIYIHGYAWHRELYMYVYVQKEDGKCRVKMDRWMDIWMLMALVFYIMVCRI